MPPFQTTANMKDLMVNVLDPAADDDLGVGRHDHRRWKAPSRKRRRPTMSGPACAAGAIQLAESGNLLMLPSRSGGNPRNGSQQARR